MPKEDEIDQQPEPKKQAQSLPEELDETEKLRRRMNRDDDKKKQQMEIAEKDRKIQQLIEERDKTGEENKRLQKENDDLKKQVEKAVDVVNASLPINQPWIKE